ncbi:unnamed protein product [Protopolystoma xenopodis]|uniref:Uncharacterized protein n=1 Tax=Protopolystoma xenopodis TaxID=117903 RepID=A0A3S5B710_9PLAT|nr:unnamed protein product [Protopolystoma xenopodis]
MKLGRNCDCPPTRCVSIKTVLLGTPLVGQFEPHFLKIMHTSVCVCVCMCVFSRGRLKWSTYEGPVVISVSLPGTGACPTRQLGPACNHHKLIRPNQPPLVPVSQASVVQTSLGLLGMSPDSNVHDSPNTSWSYPLVWARLILLLNVHFICDLSLFLVKSSSSSAHSPQRWLPCAVNTTRVTCAS